MFEFLSSKALPPDDTLTTPADKIIALHFFDDSALWRAALLYSLFVFDDVLDPTTLNSSLDQLCQKEGWRKLGARLKKTKSDTLEYHIPAVFTDDRPALAYSHAVHDMLVAAHPVASRLPKPSTKPAIVGDPEEFHDIMRPADAPKTFEDYLRTDRPQLGLHIVSFRDATLVTLY
jgi:hypothetical protein